MSSRNQLLNQNILIEITLRFPVPKPQKRGQNDLKSGFYFMQILKSRELDNFRMFLGFMNTNILGSRPIPYFSTLVPPKYRSHIANKLDHHLELRVAICVELGVFFDFVFLVTHVSLGVFVVSLHMTLDVYRPIFRFFILCGPHLQCWFSSIFSFRLPHPLQWTCTHRYVPLLEDCNSFLQEARSQ